MTESACQILRDLRTRYQGAPILTLAQTALWDDPLKALVKGILDNEAPGARLVLGVMDTDYFSRLPKPPDGLAPFDVVPHNDGSTRDLWSAVGEMHCLLGAETPLPLHALSEHGTRLCCVAVALETVGKRGDCHRFIDEITEAWGWRGLAQTRGRRLLAGDVPLREAGNALIRQVDWALEQTARVADRPLGPFARDLRTRIADFIQSHPDASLTDLYLDLLPTIYETLLGYPPAKLEYARSSELLRFNRWTANRARFRPLDLFMDPDTRPVAGRLYDEAVHAGGITTLDRFGDGAVPFEVAIPRHGRGTLHLGPDFLHIDTDEPIHIALPHPIRTRRQLAVVLEDHLGSEVALLGKAVVLITMLAHEYIFLLTETGSPYVSRSRRWNQLLHQQGLGMNLYPIMRLGVKPWDTISEAGGSLVLPPHMVRSFGAERLTVGDFEKQWRAAREKARNTLETIRTFGKPAEWLDHLAAEGPDGTWTERAREYRDLREARAVHGLTVQRLNMEGVELLSRLREAKAELNTVEHAKGRHFREYVAPAREAGDSPAITSAMVQRAGYEDRISALRAEISRLSGQRAKLSARRHALHTDPSVGIREQRMRALEGEADCERAKQVRDAWMTLHALEHSQARPTAWWFPSVDPSGRWFHAMAQSAELRWQALSGAICDDPAADV